MTALVPYIIFCILLARRDARRIKKDKTVYHNNNAELHAVCFAVVLFSCFFTHAWLALAVFFPLGKLTFDTALNLWRFGIKGIGYVSPDAKLPKWKPGSSRLDYYEWHVFKSGSRAKIAYALIIVSLLILYYYGHKT